MRPVWLVQKFTPSLHAALAKRWIQAAIFLGALLLFWLLGTRPAYS